MVGGIRVDCVDLLADWSAESRRGVATEAHSARSRCRFRYETGCGVGRTATTSVPGTPEEELLARRGQRQSGATRTGSRSQRRARDLDNEGIIPVLARAVREVEAAAVRRIHPRHGHAFDPIVVQRAEKRVFVQNAVLERNASVLEGSLVRRGPPGIDVRRELLVGRENDVTWRKR